MQVLFGFVDQQNPRTEGLCLVAEADRLLVVQLHKVNWFSQVHFTVGTAIDRYPYSDRNPTLNSLAKLANTQTRYGVFASRQSIDITFFLRSAWP